MRLTFGWGLTDLERATRIELAFSTWEADKHAETSSIKHLINWKFEDEDSSLIHFWARHGHYRTSVDSADNLAETSCKVGDLRCMLLFKDRSGAHSQTVANRFGRR
jgi:hypothetical protein